LIVDQERVKQGVVEAINLTREKRFKQSVDVTVVLQDINVKGPEGRIREIVTLPHKPNKQVRICVVATGDLALQAKNLGLEVIDKEKLQNMSRKEAKKVAKRCDWVLVQTDLMGLAGRTLGPALGPRGKVPVPVPATAILKAIVSKYERSVMVRVKNQPQIMCRVGTEDMEPEKIADNVMAVLSALEQKLPNPSTQIAKVIIKTTMGPPVIVHSR